MQPEYALEFCESATDPLFDFFQRVLVIVNAPLAQDGDAARPATLSPRSSFPVGLSVLFGDQMSVRECRPKAIDRARSSPRVV